MQRPDDTPAKPSTTSTDLRPASNVVSLAVERAKREQRRSRTTPIDPSFEGLDLFGLDFERLDGPAKRLYWFNVTNYARHLYATSCDSAIGEAKHVGAPVTVDHVKRAEQLRLGKVRREEANFGVCFLLDALQILGAATCGALATKPMMITEAAGYAPLALALVATTGIFFLREYFGSRTA